MSAVWKYEFDATQVRIDEPYYFDLEVPRNAKLLHLDVQLQSRMDGNLPNMEVPSVWAWVDPDAEKEPRRFMLVGTGHAIPHQALAYVGTFKMDQDRLVLHLFEI